MTDLATPAPLDPTTAPRPPAPELPGRGVVPTTVDRVAGALCAVAYVDERVRTVSARLAAIAPGDRRGNQRAWFGGFALRASAITQLLAVAETYGTSSRPPVGSAPHRSSAALTAPVWVIPAVVALPGDKRDAGVARLVTAHRCLQSWIHCQAYAMLAIEALDGRYPRVTASSPAAPEGAPPEALDDAPPTAVSVAGWALGQPAPLATLLRTLEPTSGPTTLAAVAGLVGLRDGLATLRPGAYRTAPQHPRCLDAAHRLVHARRQADLPAEQRP